MRNRVQSIVNVNIFKQIFNLARLLKKCAVRNKPDTANAVTLYPGGLGNRMGKPPAISGIYHTPISFNENLISMDMLSSIPNHFV